MVNKFIRNNCFQRGRGIGLGFVRLRPFSQNIVPDGVYMKSSAAIVDSPMSLNPKKESNTTQVSFPGVC